MSSAFDDGGPHEWGYRDLTDGTFIADDTPFKQAAELSALKSSLLALVGELEKDAKQERRDAAMADDPYGNAPRWEGLGEGYSDAANRIRQLLGVGE